MTALHLKDGALALRAHQYGHTFELMSGVAADLNLPGLNRLESVQGVRCEWPTLPMLKTTSNHKARRRPADGPGRTVRA